MLMHAGGSGALIVSRTIRHAVWPHFGKVCRTGGAERYISFREHIRGKYRNGIEPERDQQIRARWLGQLQKAHERAQASSSSTIQDIFPPAWTTLTFSRSSGPGGQNVNKVNSKVLLRLHLSKALVPRGQEDDDETSGEEYDGTRVPPMPFAVVRYLNIRSHYYTTSHHALTMQCDGGRSQAENIRAVFKKMLNHLQAVLGRDIEGETSEAQRNRVARLIEQEKRMKEYSKNKRKHLLEERRSAKYAMRDLNVWRD